MKKIRSAQKEFRLEGITFLGEEPFLQAKGLSELAWQCREQGLSILVFSGYTFDFLKTCDLPGADALPDAADLLTDGPYIETLPETARNRVGSTNQSFNFLTSRYGADIIYDPKYSPSAEIRISSDGKAQINGYPFLIDFI